MRRLRWHIYFLAIQILFHPRVEAYIHRLPTLRQKLRLIMQRERLLVWINPSEKW